MRGWGIICNRTQIQMSDLKDQKIFAHKPREVCRAFCNSRNNRKLLKLKEKWRKLANPNRSERAWEHLLSSYLLPFNSFSIYISMFIYIYRYKRLFCKNQSNWVEPIIEKLAATRVSNKLDSRHCNIAVQKIYMSFCYRSITLRNQTLAPIYSLFWVGL